MWASISWERLCALLVVFFRFQLWFTHGLELKNDYVSIVGSFFYGFTYVSSTPFNVEMTMFWFLLVCFSVSNMFYPSWHHVATLLKYLWIMCDSLYLFVFPHVIIDVVSFFLLIFDSTFFRLKSNQDSSHVHRWFSSIGVIIFENMITVFWKIKTGNVIPSSSMKSLNLQLK